MAVGTDREVDDCSNSTGLKTDIGLEFDSYCGTNVADNDLRNGGTNTFGECLDACANSGADPGQAPCRAVAYNTKERRCWQKDGNTTRGDLVPAGNTIMAFANDRPWLEASHSCPYSNRSIQTDENGMQYQILCGLRHKGDNFEPDEDDVYQPFHASGIQECLSYCSSNSPLCYGVLYSEGLDIGYRNCWPKNKNASSSSIRLLPDGGATTAIALLSVNSTCAGNKYTASNGASFDTSCDVAGSGPDLKTIHTDNLSDCIDECANYKPESGNGECRNVLYQPAAQDGFLNCYLKYGLDNTTSRAQWHMAALTGEGSSDGDSTNDDSTNGDSSSSSSSSSSSGAPNSESASSDGGGGGDDDDVDDNTAIIAGAVVGPVAGLALIGGLVFWWRRRRRSTSSSPQRTAADRGNAETDTALLGNKSAPGPGSSSPYGMPPPQMATSIKQDYYSPQPQPQSTPSAVSSSPPVEMDSGRRDTTELPGSQPRFEMQA